MLQEYIHQLLYRYDLVIIPDFGGIIGRKKSAKYDKDTNIFSPPFKDISYNASILENDGLLVNYISIKKNISHNEALEFVQKEVNNWKNELRENKRLVLEHIGIFNLINNRIVFLPLLTKNFLPESYGLTSFIKEPVKSSVFNNDKQLKTNITVEDQFFFEEEFKEEPKKKPNNIFKYAAIAVVGLALFGGIAYFYNNHNSNKDENYQEASFTVKEDAPAVEVTDTTSTENINSAASTETTEPNNDGQTSTTTESNSTESNSTENTSNNSDNSQKNVAESTQKNNSTNSATDLINKKYQIVVGAFQNKDNADNKVSALIQEGYSAGISGQNSNGLYIVVIDGFDDFDSANAKLTEVREKYSSAWIYKKQ